MVWDSPDCKYTPYTAVAYQVERKLVDNKQDIQHALNNTGTMYVPRIHCNSIRENRPSMKQITHTTQHRRIHPPQKNHLLLTEMPRKTATNAGTDRSRPVRPRRAPPPAPSPAAPTSAVPPPRSFSRPPFRTRRFSGRFGYCRRGSVYAISKGTLHFSRGDFLVGMVGR